MAGRARHSRKVQLFASRQGCRTAAAGFGAGLAVCGALLGLTACSDRVVAERSVKAFELHRAAAERGDQEAAAVLGGLYLRGIGTYQDTAKALYWYERAGPRGGWYAMGAIYDKGLGVPPDAEKAAEYYRKAAEAGDHPLALYDLGALYAEDRLATRDDLEGYVLLLLAERIGQVTPGCRNLSHWCNEHAIQDAPGYRAKLRGRLAPEALAEAERRATERELALRRRRGR